MTWGTLVGRRTFRILLCKGSQLKNVQVLLNASNNRIFTLAHPTPIHVQLTSSNHCWNWKRRTLRSDVTKYWTHIFRNSSSSASTPTASGTTGLADSILKSKFASENEEKKENPDQEEEDRKKQENAARAMKFSLYGLGGCFLGSGLYLLLVWGAPLKDAYGVELKDEFSDLPLPQQYLKRSWNEIKNYKTFLAEPSREKLLPDPVKPPYIQPPYTLLLEVTGVLVHPEWTYRTGWRFKKRPGIDYFLKQVSLGHKFEIVIYTQESGFTAFPIVDALDSQKVVIYSLFRDSTKYVDGHHIKDLDRINRDLSRVIMVDCNPNSVKCHRSNAIVLPKWDGNDDDRTLFELGALLNTIAVNEVNDVREVLGYYSGFADPIEEFRKKQKEFAEKEREQTVLSVKQKTGGVGSFNFIPSLFRRS